MKKTNTMRVAVLLLALALVTSCFVGGTFAKYTTTATGTDSARVAYWGFGDSSIEINDLFDHNDSGILENALIAPGSGKEVTFGFDWTPGVNQDAPEVDYTFVVTVTGNCDQLIEDNEDIHWYLDGTEVASFAALKTAIAALAPATTVEAGNLPENFEEGETHTIAWVWDFTNATNEYDVPSETLSQDEYDTYMGNKTSALNVDLRITVTAEQVDGTAAPVITPPAP